MGKFMSNEELVVAVRSELDRAQENGYVPSHWDLSIIPHLGATQPGLVITTNGQSDTKYLQRIVAVALKFCCKGETFRARRFERSYVVEVQVDRR
jgi:hypothetical protein